MSEPQSLAARAPANRQPVERQFPAEVWLPLLQETLAQNGRFAFPLRGDSMRPTLPEVCEIDVVPLEASPRPGQLIVFAVGDTLVAHRLVQRRHGLWIAQGDNRRGPDLPLKPQQVLGVVDAARAGERHVWPRRGERILATLWVARYHLLRGPRWLVRWSRQRLLR